jgi:hypothetical protein
MTMRGEADSSVNGEPLIDGIPRLRENSTATTDGLLQAPSRVFTNGMEYGKGVEAVTKPAYLV